MDFEPGKAWVLLHNDSSPHSFAGSARAQDLLSTHRGDGPRTRAARHARDLRSQPSERACLSGFSAVFGAAPCFVPRQGAAVSHALYQFLGEVACLATGLSPPG